MRNNNNPIYKKEITKLESNLKYFKLISGKVDIEMKKFLTFFLLIFFFYCSVYSQNNSKIEDLAKLKVELEKHLEKLNDYSKILKENKKSDLLFLTLNLIIELSDIRLELEQFISIYLYNTIFESIDFDDYYSIEIMRKKYYEIQKYIISYIRDKIEKILMYKIFIKSETTLDEINLILDNMRKITTVVEYLK